MHWFSMYGPSYGWLEAVQISAAQRSPRVTIACVARALVFTGRARAQGGSVIQQECRFPYERFGKYSESKTKRVKNDLIAFNCYIAYREAKCINVVLYYC